MELKQFITNTLNDIIDGIADSQAHAREKNAVVNAASVNDREYMKQYSHKYHVHDIEFDIALTVTQEDKAKGGVGAIISVFSIGVVGEDNLTNSSVTRVKFSVPVLFPTE